MGVKRLAGIALASWLWAAAMVAAQPPQPPQPELGDQVRRLVQQLDAGQLDQRREAQQRLIELGPKILPHLPQPRTRMSAQLKESIRQVRSRLESQAAQEAVNASRVTLDVQEQPVLEVLKEFSRQTGNSIVDFRHFRRQPKHNPPVSVRCEKMPFWPALDMVFSKAGLVAYPYAIDDQGEPLRAVAFVNRVEPAGSPLKWVHYQGGFRFEPLYVVTRRGLRDPVQNKLELEIEVAWEPRLAPVSLKVLYDSFKCLDDTGEPLALEVRGQQEIDLHSGTVSRFPVQYRLPAKQAERLGSLQGTIEGLIPGGHETFRFDKLAAAKNRKQKKAGATVVLQQVRKVNRPQEDQDQIGEGPSGSIWEVRILVQFETAGAALESHLMDWVTENDARLIDPQGQSIEWATMEKTREAADDFGVAYLFGLKDDIAGYTFQYQTPAALLR
ncbi:MAG: hypothetical protein GTO53_04850, partial [Planctomycetales bacterium]|nr:hypothetical protein [Planctomycetales bacterium]NIM08483.1 hypothetical protein [Planctomycetales bacterium]NIN07204.1 hypothetical protein [Planctomycetales bacterium]NIN76297.1 hypothetical protein [Planctomycetales bacterium]NIO35369.1 hypothetical protein [Planctomycetales bacterium]